MKPLKDIGNLIRPDPRSLTQFEPYLAMSLEDRRELVREVIKKWEQWKWTAFEKGKASSFQLDPVDYFIKEQEL